MIIATIARHAEKGQREVDRYTRWKLALQNLRDDLVNGKQVGIEDIPDYLKNVPEDQQEEALVDLVAEHLNATWQTGDGKNLEAYIDLLGSENEPFKSPTAISSDLVEDEFIARYQKSSTQFPTLEEYKKRFSNRHDVNELLTERLLDNGRFIKLRKLGRGAMGEVWKAYDQHSSCFVAIKQPTKQSAIHEASLSMLAREARITQVLDHPGIVNIKECQPRNGEEPFYQMRLVEGKNLSELIREYHSPQEELKRSESKSLFHQLVECFASVCDAIAYSHEHDVLHRDLKPGNIVIEDNGTAVILDWGMAKLMSDTTITQHEVAGTPEYMPPEQVDGIADKRSDVFSLSAVLYEILTCRSLYDWDNIHRPDDWKVVVRKATFPKPRQIKRKSPRLLEDICIKALSKNPDDRYQSAKEFAGEVRQYLADTSIDEDNSPLLNRIWSRFSS